MGVARGEGDLRAVVSVFVFVFVAVEVWEGSDVVGVGVVGDGDDEDGAAVDDGGHAGPRSRQLEKSVKRKAGIKIQAAEKEINEGLGLGGRSGARSRSRENLY